VKGSRVSSDKIDGTVDMLHTVSGMSRLLRGPVI
jgi:hypothetical protein